MSHRKRQFCLLAVILTGIYALYVAAMASKQQHIVFAGEGMPMIMDLRDEHAMASYTKLETTFGEVTACYLESEHEFDDCPIAIVAHGNAETIGHWSTISTHFNELGLSVFLVEYPGYGDAEGKPSKETISETFDKAYEWLSSRGLSRRKVIGIGQAFGSGPILGLANRKRFDALILLSPHTSLNSLVGSMGLPSVFLKTRYDNLAAIETFEGPALLIHGERDRLIPPAHSERLAAAAPSQTTYFPIDREHKDLWEEPEALLEMIDAWLIAQELK